MTSDEENQILEQLRQAGQQRDQVPESQRTPITNPDKFSFPIGLDDEGNPFPQPPAQSPETDTTKS